MLHPSGRVFSQTNRSTPYGTPACHGAGAENRWFRGLDDVYWCQDRGHILSARIAKIWAFFFWPTETTDVSEPLNAARTRNQTKSS